MTDIETAALRTLIVDDEPLAVERLQVLCRQIGGIEVVGTAQDPYVAKDKINELKPSLAAVAARLAIRRTGANDTLLAEVLAVCATACHLCGEECQRHAEMQDHCRLCAEACLD